MADGGSPDLVASFFTLTGAGFGEPPRHSFAERCEAAAAAGFAGIGLHTADLARTRDAGTSSGEMRALLRGCRLKLVEIEFVGDWALSDPGADPARAASSGASGSAELPDPLRRTLADVEDVADALGGRHVSAGEFRGGEEGRSTVTRRRVDSGRSPAGWRVGSCWLPSRASPGRPSPMSTVPWTSSAGPRRPTPAR